jgi:hypothetical protein
MVQAEQEMLLQHLQSVYVLLLLGAAAAAAITTLCLQLQELWAEYNSLSGTLPEAWYKLSKLQRLVLNNNSLQGRQGLMFWIMWGLRSTAW